MRLYYLIWVDCIIRLKSQPANKDNWQLLSMIFMTVSMAVDFLFMIIIIEKYILGFGFYDLQIPGLSREVNGPISFVILFVGPPLIMNYFLIFRNRRYEKLVKKYEYKDGRFVTTFILLALFFPVVGVWLGVFG
jgi:hypothetical protein